MFLSSDPEAQLPRMCAAQGFDMRDLLMSCSIQAAQICCRNTQSWVVLSMKSLSLFAETPGNQCFTKCASGTEKVEKQSLVVFMLVQSQK